MDNLFVALERAVLQGAPISESQLVCYARVASERQANAILALPEDERPFTVVWFDAKKKQSFLRHTCAKNSIEAIERVQGDVPPIANVCAYPTHFPLTLRFVPDSMVKPGQVPDVRIPT